MPDSRGARNDQMVHIRPPVVDDGLELWRLAGESKLLDANSRYAYLLWCRDFAETSMIARRDDDQPALGFATGYRRPEAPDTLFVWQLAVDERARGEGLAGRMLDALVETVDDVLHLETTITSNDDASIALFTEFADRWDATVHRRELFAEHLFGDDHRPEDRLRIGPLWADNGLGGCAMTEPDPSSAEPTTRAANTHPTGPASDTGTVLLDSGYPGVR